MSAIALTTGYKDLTLTRFLTFNIGAFAALVGERSGRDCGPSGGKARAGGRGFTQLD